LYVITNYEKILEVFQTLVQNSKKHDDQIVNALSSGFRSKRRQHQGEVGYYMSLQEIARVLEPRRKNEGGKKGTPSFGSASFLKDNDGKRWAEQSSWRRLNKSHYKLAGW